MHEGRERLPIEYAVMAFAWGWIYVLAAVALLIVLAILREAILRPKDARGDRARPFMTPALRAKLNRYAPD